LEEIRAALDIISSLTPRRGWAVNTHLSEARKGFKTSNWRLVILSWGTSQIKSWAEEGKVSGLKAREKDEREGIFLATELAQWCPVWIFWKQNYLCAVWIISVQNKTISVHYE